MALMISLWHLVSISLQQDGAATLLGMISTKEYFRTALGQASTLDGRFSDCYPQNGVVGNARY